MHVLISASMCVCVCVCVCVVCMCVRVCLTRNEKEKAWVKFLSGFRTNKPYFSLLVPNPSLFSPIPPPPHLPFPSFLNSFDPQFFSHPPPSLSSPSNRRLKLGNRGGGKGIIPLSLGILFTNISYFILSLISLPVPLPPSRKITRGGRGVYL